MKKFQTIIISLLCLRFIDVLYEKKWILLGKIVTYKMVAKGYMRMENERKQKSSETLRKLKSVNKIKNA